MQILKTVMLAGGRAAIACLPVHDVPAVQQVHADRAKGAILSAWARTACPDEKSGRAIVVIYSGLTEVFPPSV